MLLAYIAFGLLRPLPELKPTLSLAPQPAVATVGLSWPPYGEAAVGAEGYGLLATHGSQLSLPSASVAKVITALAVLQKKPLNLNQQGPSLIIGPQDVAFYNSYLAVDGSVVPVQAGERISEYQALQAVLLPSANNLAESLATWAFGSEAAYTDFANAYVRQLGLAGTHVADASGFAPATVTTAADLVRVGLIAMRQPVLAQIVGQSEATLPLAGTVRNINLLLGSRGVVGIKTGNTNEAGGVFLLAAKVYASRTPVTIVTAVMGAPDLWQSLRDSVPLLADVKTKFNSQRLVKAGDIVGHYPMPWGGTIDAVAQKDVVAVGWQGTVRQADIQLQSLPPGTPAQQTVGTIAVKHSLSQHTAQPVVLTRPITKPGWPWRLTHPF